MSRDLAGARLALGMDKPLDDVMLLDAVATACLLMASADGEIAPEETRRIAEVLITLAGSTENRDLVQGVLDGLAREVVSKGQAHYLALLKERVRDPVQRRKTLAYAAAVAWADDQLDDAEQELLGQLAQTFGVGGDELGKLVGLLRSL